MKNYDSMTAKELTELNHKLGIQESEIREERRAIMVELSGRDAEERVKKLAEGLDDKGKERLAQVLSPKGIATKEKVGRPGTK